MAVVLKAKELWQFWETAAPEGKLRWMADGGAFGGDDTAALRQRILTHAVLDSCRCPFN
jgi:hypothetical protein